MDGAKSQGAKAEKGSKRARRRNLRSLWTVSSAPGRNVAGGQSVQVPLPSTKELQISFAPSWLSSRASAVIAAAAVSAGLVYFNTVAAREAERDNLSGGSFLEIDGVRLHYLSKGEGPTIVLLHGNGSMIQDWMISGLVDELAQTHRVVAFDRPGFGYTERPRPTVWTPEAQAELLSKAFVELNLGPTTVVGHSFATLVTLALALNHPEIVSRLVLVGGYYYPSARWDVVLGSGPAIPVVGDAIRYTVSPVIGRLLKPAANREIFAPAPVPRQWEENYPTELAARPSQIRAVAAEAALMVPASARLSQHYDQLKLPVTIIAGAGDKVVDPSQSAKLHAELSQSEFLLIPEAGHMVHHTAAKPVGDAISGQTETS